MAEFKRVIQRTTNSERIESGVAQLEVNEFCIIEDGEEVIYKNKDGEYVSISKDKYTVGTIEELKSSKKYKVGDVVQVLGYYEPGDGGGHTRQKELNGYASKDAVTGIDGSIWRIVDSGTIDIRWLGAKMDGVSNDTIFIKLAMAYNKKTLLLGNILLTEILIDIQNIFDIKCNFVDKQILQSSRINQNLPKRKLLGSFNYSQYTTKNHQSLAYNKNTNEYILGFSAPSVGELSTIIILDSNFNYVRKFDLDLGHINGLAFNPKTNKIVSSGYLDVQEKNGYIFTVDYTTLELVKVADVEYTTVSIGYDELKDIYMVGSVDKYTLLDDSFNVVYSVNLKANNIHHLVSQDAEFFKGHYCISYYHSNPACGKNYIICYDLNGNETNRFQFDARVGNDEPEGLYSINDNEMVMSSYWYDKIIRFYHLDFNFKSLNISQTNIPSSKVIYIDSNAESEGDGTPTFPYKTIETGIENNLGCEELILRLKGEFNSKSLSGSYRIEITSWDTNNKAIFDGQLTLSSFSSVYMGNIIFEPSNAIDRILFISESSGYLENLRFVQPIESTSAARGCGFYRSNIRITNSYFENCSAILASSEASIAQCENLTGTRNHRRFVSNGGIILHSRTNVGTELDSLSSDSAIFPNINIANLDTPYYTYKMQSNGIYDQYIKYRDELHEYQYYQREIEKQKQLAYEEALKENPNLTYEEFLENFPMLLPTFEEPQPSEALIAFKEKYLG